MRIAVDDVEWISAQNASSEPKPGFLYVIVSLSIENLGPGLMESVGSWDFEVKDESGVIRGDEYVWETRDCDLELVDLAPGGKTSGCISFEVPDSGALDLIYAPYQYGNLEEGRYLSFSLRP